MAGSYMLAYMDKVALSNAAIMGIIKDTVQFTLYLQLCLPRRQSDSFQEPDRIRLFLGVLCLLLWIPWLELALFIPHRQIPARKVSSSYGVSWRGQIFSIPWRLRTKITCRAVWGVTLMCHAACHNFTGLMIARFFLGVTEAAMSPGLALIVGMFYKRHEQPLR